VRAGGALTNGGGFDSTVAGAGTNYADQDSPQLTLTDVATAGVSATITSVTGGFTSQMVGNVVAFSSGTNFIVDRFVIVTYISSTSVTLDRNCTTGVGASGNMKVGGAMASPANLTVGGSGTGANPTTPPSPLIPGNTVNIRGAGTQDPSTFDYDMSSGYYEFINGNNTATTSGGAIRFVGYNGRPYIKHCGLLSFGGSGGTQFGNVHQWKNIKFVQTVGSFGIGDTHNLCDAATNSFYNCIFDANGFATQILDFGNSANAAGACVCCEIRNSAGGAAATTGWGIRHNHGGGFVFGTWIHGQRQHGIQGVGVFGSHMFCLINANLKYGYNDLENDGSKPIPLFFMNCTFDGNSSGAMNFAALGIFNNTIQNCIFANHTTAATAALTFADSLATNTQKYRWIGYNDYFNNTANFNGSPAVWGINKTVDAGLSGDLTLDPQYTNSAGNDYSTGSNLAGKGLLWCSNFTSTSYTMRMGGIA